jgi:hypothetical protein
LPCTIQHWPQLGALGVRLDEVDHPPQDCPFVRIEVATSAAIAGDLRAVGRGRRYCVNLHPGGPTLCQ